jgi:NAD-dependent SIR2 family protein deacetylase
MAESLEHSLQKPKGFHKTLIRNMKDNEIINNTVFISSNYDILCDNALLSQYEIDYGIEFVANESNIYSDRVQDNLKLFKIHGSLNWLYCPVCNSVKLTPKEKSIYNLITKDIIEKTICQKCKTQFLPITVPPTYYKDFSNPFLNQIWHKTEVALQNVEHLVFCGYSFPDADMHIKYLIKRIQTNRVNNTSLKISVINHFKGKLKSISKEEETRFNRFLGPDVNYTEMSFQEFAENPMKIMNQI